MHVYNSILWVLRNALSSLLVVCNTICYAFRILSFSKDKAMFTLFLASSKTDPFKNGITISFKKNSMSCYMYMELHSGIRQQSLLSNAPLFVDDRGHPFSRDLFISYLRQVISHLGFSSTDNCGHSFRIRASTTTAAVGIKDHMIKTLGRWKFSCYMRYIHVDKGSLKEAQQELTQVKPSFLA